MMELPFDKNKACDILCDIISRSSSILTQLVNFDTHLEKDISLTQKLIDKINDYKETELLYGKELKDCTLLNYDEPIKIKLGYSFSLENIFDVMLSILFSQNIAYIYIDDNELKYSTQLLCNLVNKYSSFYKKENIIVVKYNEKKIKPNFNLIEENGEVYILTKNKKIRFNANLLLKKYKFDKAN